MNIFVVEGYLMLVVTLLLLAMKVFAFINAFLWSAESYEVAGKLTKPAWTILLGIGVALQVVQVLFILSLAFTVAAIVYLVDVRPALAGLSRR